MTYDMNQAMRRTGNRARTLPDIGQNQGVPSAGAQMAIGTPSVGSAAPSPVTTSPNPTTSPTPSTAAQTPPFALHPPGTPADPTQYNYELQPNGAWTVYPPGVVAPDGAHTTSMPRAASTADYGRMSQAIGQSIIPGTPQV